MNKTRILILILCEQIITYITFGSLFSFEYRDRQPIHRLVIHTCIRHSSSLFGFILRIQTCILCRLVVGVGQPPALLRSSRRYSSDSILREETALFFAFLLLLLLLLLLGCMRVCGFNYFTYLFLSLVLACIHSHINTSTQTLVTPNETRKSKPMQWACTIASTSC